MVGRWRMYYTSLSKTVTDSPSKISSALRTLALMGKIYTPSLLGNIEVSHVVLPMVACTRTDPQPFLGRGSAFILAVISGLIVIKYQAAAWEGYFQRLVVRVKFIILFVITSPKSHTSHTYPNHNTLSRPRSFSQPHRQYIYH